MQGKLLRFCFIYIESAAIAQSIHRENFHGSSKIHDNHEGFLSHSFRCLQYIIILLASLQVLVNKLDGAVYESSAEKQICKSKAIVKFADGSLHLWFLWLVGWLQAKFSIKIFDFLLCLFNQGMYMVLLIGSIANE